MILPSPRSSTVVGMRGISTSIQPVLGRISTRKRSTTTRFDAMSEEMPFSSRDDRGRSHSVLFVQRKRLLGCFGCTHGSASFTLFRSDRCLPRWAFGPASAWFGLWLLSFDVSQPRQVTTPKMRAKTISHPGQNITSRTALPLGPRMRTKNSNSIRLRTRRMVLQSHNFQAALRPIRELP
jgi:hypothetical protein